MSAPVEDTNQFDVLSSPTTDESKTQSRFASRKDDIKEQMHSARDSIKSKAIDLKEQVTSKVTVPASVTSSVQGVISSVSSQLQPVLDMAKEKAGLSKDASIEEVTSTLSDQASEVASSGWQEVKRRGNKQASKLSSQVDAKLNENLTPEQRQQLKKGVKQAKKNAAELQSQASGWSSSIISSTLSGPRLRPIKSFILRNNLQLPVVILMSLFTLWLGLSIIRLITTVTHPAQPEFDIHSSENTMNWLKFHAGDYKDRAIDMKDSLAVRAAAFLANHEWDKLKNSAIDYREIGMRKLGLHEPTWSEWAWARLTGRPITWQDRVESVLSLAKAGISRKDLAAAAGSGLFDRVKNFVSPTPEPSLTDKIRAHVPGMHPAEPAGIVDSMKATLQDGIDTIRSKLPGGESAEVLRQRAYEATHPSTIDQIKSGANYIKNRVIHSAQEASHIAQDRANEASDKAKFKMGL